MYEKGLCISFEEVIVNSNRVGEVWVRLRRPRAPGRRARALSGYEVETRKGLSSSSCDVICNGFAETRKGLMSSSCDVICNGFAATPTGMISSLRDVIRNGFAGVDRGFGDGGFGVRRALFLFPRIGFGPGRGPVPRGRPRYNRFFVNRSDVIVKKKR